MYAEFKLICTYCGHKYTFSPQWHNKEATCPICKDRHPRSAPDETTKDVFGYGNSLKKDAYLVTPETYKDEETYD